MKEIMLILIGVGSGFAVCGCLMFYVMAAVTRANSRKNKFDETTIELMRERNACDWKIESHLRHISSHVGDRKKERPGGG